MTEEEEIEMELSQLVAAVTRPGDQRDPSQQKQRARLASSRCSFRYSVKLLDFQSTIIEVDWRHGLDFFLFVISLLGLRINIF